MGSNPTGPTEPVTCVDVTANVSLCEPSKSLTLQAIGHLIRCSA